MTVIENLGTGGVYSGRKQNVILPAIFEPPVRTFGATIPVFESQLFQ